jgi:pyruvate-ferredoxin/flavodoxin oxidoreductase
MTNKSATLNGAASTAEAEKKTKAGRIVTITGNQAAAHVAYAYSEVAAIYPITPSSDMGEFVDTWASEGRKNIYGEKLEVIEMQSEGGAAGAVHGSLTAGALTTTFTASQGLLLMIPNMHKIAGEMLPAVIHVAARALACQSLSIFGDHSDVMSVRNTGFAMLASSSVQEVMDQSIVAHLSTLKAEIPFVSFFDGFRTSSEIQKVDEVSYETLKDLLEPQYLMRFRDGAMRPEKPCVKVGAQNPDVYFQGRETVNKYYDAVPGIVQEYMDKVAAKTGRQYHLFDYYGAPDATHIVVSMGSSCETIEETIDYLRKQGKKVGLVKIRLFRPFSVEAFAKAIPTTVQRIAVLDRTKEPGSIGEPLYLDVTAALADRKIKIIGGRYGLGSKEFTPSMVKAIFDHLEGPCTHGFTVGITDDVSGLSLPVKEQIYSEADDVISCTFWGLGSDGTVGANKDSIKLIGDHTDLNASGYFVYDSKKSYGITISHLRFGKSPIRSPYLVSRPSFVACHNPAYIGRYDMLKGIRDGGVFLLNSEFDRKVVFEHLTEDMQKTIIDKKIKFYTIDALKISEAAGLGARINTVMMTAFFKISGVLEENEALQLIKSSIKKTYGKKGEEVVKMNFECVDRTSEALVQVEIPKEITKSYKPARLIAEGCGEFPCEVMLPVMHLKGDDLPVSKMSYDGKIPSGTSCLEKRGIAPRVPRWIPENCIQCNQCVNACPHAVVRAKQMTPEDLAKAPKDFVTVESKTKNENKWQFRLQVYVDDCTGCGVCVETCPAKTKALEFSTLEKERTAGQVENYTFFEALPDNVGGDTKNLKSSQFIKPLFEFSGACGGCGETPYIKLITQLFGERMVVANATGCSSIYGGTFPAIPYCKTKEGLGPAWANSLFEDNAEYGYGMRLAIDSNRKTLKTSVEKLVALGCDQDLQAALKKCLELWDNKQAEAQGAQKAVCLLLPCALEKATAEQKPFLAKINELKDYFVDKSVWCIGGDGWAYDIGYGGLDHVLASGRNINVLVLDTEVYSNTGGQASKSTPIGAVAKFANAGKRLGKKNLGLMMMSYGYVYVASIALGANRNLALKAMLEAEEYNGPSIVIAYSPCIAHGMDDMMQTQTEQRRAVEAGYWPLYRYNPTLEKSFTWDSKEITGNFQEFIKGERRYTSLLKTAPADAERVYAEAEKDAHRRFELFKKMGELL